MNLKAVKVKEDSGIEKPRFSLIPEQAVQAFVEGEISAYDLSLLACIANDHAPGKAARMSLARLMEISGLSIMTVAKSLHKLEDKGLLNVERTAPKSAPIVSVKYTSIAPYALDYYYSNPDNHGGDCGGWITIL